MEKITYIDEVLLRFSRDGLKALHAVESTIWVDGDEQSDPKRVARPIKTQDLPDIFEEVDLLEKASAAVNENDLLKNNLADLTEDFERQKIEIEKLTEQKKLLESALEEAEGRFSKLKGNGDGNIKT